MSRERVELHRLVSECEDPAKLEMLMQIAARIIAGDSDEKICAELGIKMGRGSDGLL